MKKRISDLLDDYRENSLELNDSTPLSSERIKELTMSKINHKKEKKSKRTLFRVAVAAATISALTLTVAAAEEIFGAGEWFRGILNDQLKGDRQMVQENGLNDTVRETLSEGQLEVLNSLGKVFEEQTYTNQGTTMTLTAAYGGENVIHLYMKVLAPEGTVLPDDIDYEFYDWNAVDYSDPNHFKQLTAAEEAPYDQIYGYNVDIVPLTDTDPSDNQKDFHVIITAQSNQEMKFNDGYSKYLNITGIYQQVLDVNGDEDGFTLLAPGTFTFDFGIANEIEKVELDVEGLTYGGEKTRIWTHDSDCIDLCERELTGQSDPETGLPLHSESWNYSVTVKHLTLSSLSAEWKVEYTSSDVYKDCSLAFKVVMKDGTTALNEFGEESGYRNQESKIGWSEGVTLFAAPIDMDEVDYILIGDPEVGSTHKVYLP